MSTMADRNPISWLSEFCAKKRYRQPEFQELLRTGPPNQPTFTCRVVFGPPSAVIEAQGQGLTLKAAKTAAALQAHSKLMAGSQALPKIIPVSPVQLRPEIIPDSELPVRQIPLPDESSTTSPVAEYNENKSPSTNISFCATTFSEETPFESLTLLCNCHNLNPPRLEVRAVGTVIRATVLTTSRTKAVENEFSAASHHYAENKAVLEACGKLHRMILAVGPALSDKEKVTNAAHFPDARKASGQRDLQFAGPSSSASDHLAKTSSHYKHILECFKRRNGNLEANVNLAEESEEDLDEVSALKTVAEKLNFTHFYQTYSRRSRNLAMTGGGGETDPQLRICQLKFEKSKRELTFPGKGATLLEADEDCARKALQFIRYQLQSNPTWGKTVLHN